MKQSASGDLLLWDVTLNFGETNLEQSCAPKQEIRLDRVKAATNKILPLKIDGVTGEISSTPANHTNSPLN
ncbi:hypothetical protein T03_11189 [Trichinella britovi]|uniref:Uncharacterized protein n=1 Tax=Trichinella britovi TaxID=45882 RepID=A0A0V1AXP0_TRIBR|nr:hypothetical protein T03_11189 [Trichinella britovi]